MRVGTTTGRNWARAGVINLVGNAVTFPAVGGIRVDVKLDEAPAAGARPCLLFAIHDTGEGISDEQQQAIFEPFVQADVSTSRRFGGTGLGLAISRTLIDLMGGSFRVQSRHGHGSTLFTFDILLHRDTAVATRPGGSVETASETTPPGQTVRVLLVEDNDVNRRLAQVMLRKAGHLVVTANNGREALEVLEQEVVDLVLLDVQMPEMDGFEAARRIREREGRRLCREAVPSRTGLPMRTGCAAAPVRGCRSSRSPRTR